MYSTWSAGKSFYNAREIIRRWKIIFYMGVLEIEIASMGVWTGGRFSRIGLVAHVHDWRLDP